MSRSAAILRTACPVRNVYQGAPARVLFVCTMGLLRSATMATMAAQRGINARACGTDRAALVPLSETLIEWADQIVFADVANKIEALEAYPDWHAVSRAEVWSIPDHYDYMDAWLCKLLQPKIDALPKVSGHYERSTKKDEGEMNAS